MTHYDCRVCDFNATGGTHNRGGGRDINGMQTIATSTDDIAGS